MSSGGGIESRVFLEARLIVLTSPSPKSQPSSSVGFPTAKGSDYSLMKAPLKRLEDRFEVGSAVDKPLSALTRLHDKR